MTRPLLSPPCTGWKEDLPPPNATSTIEKSLGSKTPNHQDSNYLEIPRSSLAARGLISLFSLPLSIVALNIPGMIIDSYHENDTDFMIIGPLSLIVVLWAIIFTLRVDISPPQRRTHPFQSRP